MWTAKLKTKTPEQHSFEGKLVAPPLFFLVVPATVDLSLGARQVRLIYAREDRRLLLLLLQSRLATGRRSKTPTSPTVPLVVTVCYYVKNTHNSA